MELALPEHRQQTLAHTLSQDELARAARFRRLQDRQRFATARGQLREVLSIYTHSSPGQIRFTYSPYGKPALDSNSVTNIRFNLTHSGTLALLAVTADHEVGIDLEEQRREVDFLNIARRYFAPAEAASLESLPVEQQPQAFFDGWVRKESFIKAQGQGLHMPLDAFEVSLDPSAPARLIKPSEGWTLLPLYPRPGYSAAVVVEGRVEGARTFQWQPVIETDETD